MKYKEILLQIKSQVASSVTVFQIHNPFHLVFLGLIIKYYMYVLNY